MNEEYLWNREGEPEPETARLEKLLAPLAYRQKPKHSRGRRLFWIPVAIAAGLAVFAIVQTVNRPQVESAWRISAPDGKTRAVRQGELISTPHDAGVSLESNSIGEIKVEPNSRLRMVRSAEEQRFNLQRGVIHALIWAPPARFVVDTPSAKTIDLGCRYTLRVDDDGAGLLTVDLGWVAFQAGRTESFIPAGAACATRPRHGPGTPYFQDADGKLIQALNAFDQKRNSDRLDTVIMTARAKDAITLWHLLSRTEGPERQRVFTRFAQLVELPPAVTETAILRGDAAALDTAWDSLELGDTSWWRTWKRPWQ